MSSWLVRHWPKVVAGLVSVALVLVAWTWASYQATKSEAYRETLALQNDRIIDCTTPGRPCFEEAQKRSRQTLAGALGEIDCIARRIHADLPPYDPRKGACAAQTPPDVYPGAAS